jgi:hypothetical protein
MPKTGEGDSIRLRYRLNFMATTELIRTSINASSSSPPRVVSHTHSELLTIWSRSRMSSTTPSRVRKIIPFLCRLVGGVLVSPDCLKLIVDKLPNAGFVRVNPAHELVNLPFRRKAKWLYGFTA